MQCGAAYLCAQCHSYGTSGLLWLTGRCSSALFPGGRRSGTPPVTPACSVGHMLNPLRYHRVKTTTPISSSTLISDRFYWTVDFIQIEITLLLLCSGYLPDTFWMNCVVFLRAAKILAEHQVLVEYRDKEQWLWVSTFSTYSKTR